MVLAELGGKLRESLRKLHASSSSADDASELEQTVTTLVSEIARALIEADVNVKLVMKLRDAILQKCKELTHPNPNTTTATASKQQPPRGANLGKLVQKIVVEELIALVSPSSHSTSTAGGGGGGGGGGNKPLLLKRGKTNVILFVGLQGAGKTTTIAKYANYHAKRGYKVAMVCCDTFRAGALDQLKQNAVKLRIPFYGSHTIADPVRIGADGVKKFTKDGYELVLVDTSGRHQQEASLFEEMQEISAVTHPHQVILVMDATQGQSIGDQASAFASAVKLGGVIITKLDGHAKGGGALSAVAASNAPILFLGEGEHFDDLEPFNAQSFVSKLLGFGDIRGLVQAINDVSSGGDPKKTILKNMESGQFTLRDLYQQYQNMLNVGPLNRFAGNSGLIPGMPPMNEALQQQQLRRFMIMMDSMTAAELDGKVDLRNKFDPAVESRLRRIARGSGCHPEEVKLLLLSHKQMEGFVRQMGKSGVVSKQNQLKQQQFLAQARKNPNLIQQRVNQMDPKTLQQLGGRDAVIAMMQQQLAKGGGGGGGGGGNDDVTGMMMPPPAAGGGFPGMPGMPPGMDMDQLVKMAQAMGMSPPGGFGGGGGGFPGAPRR